MQITYPNGTILKIFEIRGTPFFIARVEGKDGFTRKILGDSNTPFTNEAIEAIKVIASHFDSVYLGMGVDSGRYDYACP